MDKIINGKMVQLVALVDPITGDAQVAAALTDRSGNVASIGVAQTLMPANPNRRGYWIQNNSANVIWINEMGVDATQGRPSIQIVGSGGSYASPPGAASPLAISVIGPVAGAAYSAREW